MTQSSIKAFRNWSDHLLEMKTRKVVSCRVQAGASWGEGTDRGNRVPIGTQGTVLPYIDPTEGPPRFCMDWVGKGRCPAFCKKMKRLQNSIEK